MPVTTSIWQRELAQAIRDPRTLIEKLGLNHDGIDPVAANDFRVLVPNSFLARMQYADWNDPLLKQVLPVSAEHTLLEGFTLDPVGDEAATVANGVLHKYHGRVLLITTGACAIHCRYCFRRHFPYQASTAAKNEWEHPLAYLRQHTDVQEIILSGGDPLTLSDERLHGLFSALTDLPHIKRVRFHTRLPVVLPSRIDESFSSLLSDLPLQTVMVLHINHANELNAPDVQQALKRLRATGITLLNQAVLLRGINDSLEAQIALSETLFAHGILPYYLHVLDRVAGAAHFEVPEPEALTLIQALRARVAGFLVPRLVREIAGESAKTPLERLP